MTDFAKERFASDVNPDVASPVISVSDTVGDHALSSDEGAVVETKGLANKRVAMVVFSYYQFDPRPRRAAEALAGVGMKVDLFCLREGGGDRKRELLNGVSIRRVSIKRRRGGVLAYLYQYSGFLLMVSSMLAMRSLTRHYDLVYVHNMPDFLVFSALIPKIFGAKVVLDLHDPMPELMRTIFGLVEDAKGVSILKFIERRSMAFADSIVTVNRACAKLFAARSCSPAKITVIMNSPDEDIFQFRKPRLEEITRERDRPFVVMYHGSMVERNGLDLAVEAFRTARSNIPNAELRIYGSRNAFLDQVMTSVRDQGLGGSVQYMGEKPVEELSAAIEECDLGIIPNRRNVFTELNTPTRIFEYLAIGKPVIAPHAPGIREYFDENSLTFFELGDAPDLAKKIEYAFTHPDETMGTTHRGQEVYQAHTWRSERSKLLGMVVGLVVDSAAQNVSANQSQQPTPPSDSDRI